MHINDFRTLVVSEHPCGQGLAWLDKFIKTHPDATTTDFFKWAVTRRGMKASSCSCGCGILWYDKWLGWVVANVLDWREEPVRPYLGALEEDVSEALSNIIGVRSHEITPKIMADALINAFEED